MKVPPEALECEMFKSRVTPFLLDVEHGQKIFVNFGQERSRLKKKTKRDGRFQSWLVLPNEKVKRLQQFSASGIKCIDYAVTTNHRKSSVATNSIFLMKRHGVSVISDIDDTIKVSGVINRKELLANTFLREFRAIDGMQAVYDNWSKSGFDFHYVSSSPWQLYESLKVLTDEMEFPQGSLHLRNFRFRDQLLKKMPLVRAKGKTSAIRLLLKHMPERKFILVGDSGEKDPEIYAKAARKHPGQVKAIFIRDLNERPIDRERLESITDKIPRPMLHRFKTADELAALAAPYVESLTPTLTV